MALMSLEDRGQQLGFSVGGGQVCPRSLSAVWGVGTSRKLGRVPWGLAGLSGGGGGLGDKTACPVTELPSLPAGPSACLARLPWEPGRHLQESHVRDSPSKARATGPSATIRAPVGSLTPSSLFSSSRWVRALHPWLLWAGHCLAQASALS